MQLCNLPKYHWLVHFKEHINFYLTTINCSSVHIINSIHVSVLRVHLSTFRQYFSSYMHMQMHAHTHVRAHIHNEATHRHLRLEVFSLKQIKSPHAHKMIYYWTLSMLQWLLVNYLWHASDLYLNRKVYNCWSYILCSTVCGTDTVHYARHFLIAQSTS